MSDNYLTLTITTGRSGSKYIYDNLINNHSGGYIYHELLHAMFGNAGAYFRSYQIYDQELILNAPYIERLVKFYKSKLVSSPVVDFGWTMSALVPALYSVFNSRLKVLSIVRHPISVAASSTTIGLYTKNSHEDYLVYPHSKGARFKDYEKMWDSLNSFEKCLYRWFEITNYSYEIKKVYPDLEVMYVRSEDFFNNVDLLYSVYNFSGFNIARNFKLTNISNEINPSEVEINPLKNDWKTYSKHLDIIKFAESLGYNMNEDYVEKLVNKYDVPKGLLSNLRYRTRYWEIRAYLAHLLRNYGILKQQRNKLMYQLNNPNFLDDY